MRYKDPRIPTELTRNLLADISQAEYLLEEKREALSLDNYFTLFEAFRFFDRDGRGYIYA
jgi:hypothetical protein